MNAYYNEFDPFAAEWLRGLIREGLIAPGDVDERDIRDVQPGDLAGYEQCHFFAGIGGWSYALRLAGWPDSRPVWTGSCPCQPFSLAGKGKGLNDPRHLWPTWVRLIRELKPPIVFGEQVASADGLAWIDHVSTDLEAADYAFGAADLAAAGAGAPHKRQRLFWLAHSNRNGAMVEGSSGVHSERHAAPEVQKREDVEPGSDGAGTNARGRHDWRREPAMARLADGIPGGVGRGFGNAIVPQVAAEFIGAYLETGRLSDRR